MNKIELYNKHNELLLILIVEGDFDNENFTQILEESLIEYINENTDIDENEIDYYKLVWQNVSDKESQWYTSNVKISNKQNVYFYNVNTNRNG